MRTVRRLDVGGTVLGPVPTARYECGKAVLEPGDMLVLYTDGVSERMNPSNALCGPYRIHRLVSTLLNQPARLVITSRLTEVDAFAGGVLGAG